ncbi:MAG TPA: S24 family peptidase [Paludibacter sp.]|nr:S24 family peptidase [Paludibacter sp.]
MEQELPELNNRVFQLINELCAGNVSEFARQIGVKQQTIDRLFKIDKRTEKFPRVKSEIIDAALLTFKRVDKVWLLTGNGKMFNDPELISFDDNLSKIVKTIPYYPDVNASAGLDFLTENGNNYSVPIKIPNVDAQAFINVFGDSMYPKYCSGEIIGIKEIEKDMVFPGHAFVIQMTDGEAYIKYIDPGKDDDHWILRSENPHYKPKQFHLSKIHKVYIIKAVITKSTLL